MCSMFSNDGYIAREEMMALLQNCLNLSGQEEEGEDGIKVAIVLCRYHFVASGFIDSESLG